MQRWSVTLGKFLAVPEGESGPPWAQQHFSFRFSGLPPVEAYEETMNYEDAMMDTFLTPAWNDTEDPKNSAPSKAS